jgi:RNA recognition motif-containing protein
MIEIRNIRFVVSGSLTIEMYRMTKADMENEINSLKRGPDRTTRRPPLLHHEPTIGNVRNDNSPHLLPTPTNFQRHPGSPVNTHSYPIQTNFNQDSSIICLRLRNIPYSTTEQQIYEYFSGQIEGCKILLDRFNRGAGEALIRFRDPKLCQSAYESKNRQIFYGRTLDLRPLSLNEFQSASVTPMLTANDLASPTTMNQHFQQTNTKRYPPFYERDDDRRNDKRPRWDGGHNKGNSKSIKMI